MDATEFEAIGTHWRIDTPLPLTPHAGAAVLAIVEEYDAVYSRFRADSRIAQLAPGGSITLPAHGDALGRLYRTLYRLTDGAMSPLAGTSLEQLGYDAGYSFVPRGAPAAAPDWDGNLDWNGVRLTAHASVTLDVGAAGKGQLVDLVSDLLCAAGYPDHVVDAGGDMVHRGATPAQVALEHPYAAGSAIGVVELGGRALCASSSNRRRWADGLHHVVNAATGHCVDTVVATWVLAADAMTADGLATALFLAEPDTLLAEFSFDYIQVFSDGHARFSSPLDGALF
ncbi:FAD:protein FMN transferase [Arthrobacter sp. H5]|uniref:FAD:protein FMN transferase n=1 Tax=Arthrobacter sp. H5 TaxID=1267973 RepID=UPI000484E722|nr:FAD:protein FMN transferase [Arthrobacter sp. H5]